MSAKAPMAQPTTQAPNSATANHPAMVGLRLYRCLKEDARGEACHRAAGHEDACRFPADPATEHLCITVDGIAFYGRTSGACLAVDTAGRRALWRTRAWTYETRTADGTCVETFATTAQAAKAWPSWGGKA